MVAADVLGMCAGGWGVVMAIAPALQIRKMLHTRTAADVSLGFFAVLLPGYVLWVAYGFSRGDLALVIPNAVAFCVAVATMLVARHFRRNPADPQDLRTGQTAQPAAGAPA
jgi:MtN3 and saliva related transmembrane protein